MQLKKKKVSTDKVRGIELISHLKLPRIQRPKFADTLLFPEDITDLDSRNISELLGKYTLLFSYVQQDIASLSRDILAMETREKRRRTEMLRERKALNTIEKNKREGIFNTDEEIEEAQDQRQILMMRREVSMGFLTIYDRYISALSRELTRKSAEENVSYTNHLRGKKFNR